jgi:hypothetical protein
MTVLYIVTALLFLALPGSAASAGVQQILEDYLSHDDLKAPPDTGILGDRLDTLRSAPVAEVRQILPLGLSLLRSPNPNLQTVGSMTLIAIFLRMDSAALVAPNLPELVTLFTDHDQTHDGTGLGLLAMLNPKPPASLVPYLLPRLLDSKASTQQLLALSGVLMRAAPDDPAVIGGILNLLQEHPGPVMKSGVLQMMAGAHPAGERVLALFDSGLADPDSNVRSMAVQAVWHNSPEAIRHSEPQLRKIAADPDEQSSTRGFASAALRQIHPVPKAPQ